MLKLFLTRRPLSQPIISCRTSTLPASQEHPTLPNYSTANTNQRDNFTTQSDNLADHTSVNDDTESHIKVYSKTNCHFSPPSFFKLKSFCFQNSYRTLVSSLNSQTTLHKTSKSKFIIHFIQQ